MWCSYSSTLNLEKSTKPQEMACKRRTGSSNSNAKIPLRVARKKISFLKLVHEIQHEKNTDWITNSKKSSSIFISFFLKVIFLLHVYVHFIRNFTETYLQG